MEEATEIAKLRLFLALVASAHHVDDLEPLPNIDFNIMAGNSLMGLMRVDSSRFDTQKTQSNIGASGKVIQQADLFRPAVVQFDLFGENKAKGYQQLINEKEAALRAYRNAQNLDSDALQTLKESIQTQRDEAYKVLNQLLLDEFNTLGIRYEAVTWDTAKNKEGKPTKRPLTLADIEALQPFHWGYEFSEIFTKKNGFDAVIANPPWEVFKPNSKEFFLKYSDVVTKNKMNIKDFEKEQSKLLENTETRAAWFDYQSSFPHVSAYFRASSQFRNQISIVNGKKAGSDINLYKLFTEQSYNLLRDQGYCGIVIPSGIYTDLGTKQLRQLLFEQTQITGLFCFENRKEIFENVHRSFKFIVLSFEKGGTTTSFPAAFMRHNVEELALFPKYGANMISVDFIKRQSPDSLSIMEMKNEMEFQIVEQMLKFPLLGDKMARIWNVKLGNEIHMTNDSHLFRIENKGDYLPVYEGKMIHQFDSQFSQGRYWINEQEGRKVLLGREEDKDQIVGYQTYRLAFRDIARNTDIRTLIASILPKKAVTGNTLVISKNELSPNDLLGIVTFLNSFVVDFLTRQKVTAHCNMFYIYQLPVPRLRAGDRFYEEIVERAARLICTTEEFAELWEEVMPNTWSAQSGATAAEQRNQLRAELDAMVAHCYGLTAAELEYILSTFPLVAAEQKALVLAEFERLDVLLKAESQNHAAALQLIQAGESPTVEFKSTLRIDLRTLRTEKFIEHSVLKTIAAFLNSEGGTLLIGVEDNKNILGLQPDFDSFSKPDKLDEFQKHFDNLLGKTFGNHVHHYLNVSFPSVEGKTLCMVEIKEKSAEPFYITDENGKETFYIRRLASTIDLRLSEAAKYIQEHWK
ncbi:Eco57I restriction-modification methylase domain-containing protein [Runella rosea]|uniref:Eco57I restriction-modification methylase domain-containing protein n=1 Tax=Runella rosea TaxID=2259595 RepID=UPI0019651150|nr:RNA-binding domain-containing protein [Runella rosea]